MGNIEDQIYWKVRISTYRESGSFPYTEKKVKNPQRKNIKVHKFVEKNIFVKSINGENV